MATEAELLGRLARSSGLSRGEIRRFVEFGVVSLRDGPVEPAQVRRLRRARRLRHDLGLSVDAVVIILRLLDRIEVLEGTRRWRGAVRILKD
jgi:hypothetical protein